MRATCKKDSIYVRLIKLLLLAGVLAIAFFYLVLYAGDYLVNAYFTNGDYQKQHSEKSAESLQEFVTQNTVGTSDIEQLNHWIKEQRVVSIQIFKDDILVYDSAYPEETDLSEKAIVGEYYDWEYYYDLTFADGAAKVLVYGFYEYQIYNYTTIGTLVVSFLVFVFIVMLGIRKTMKYIQKLSNEIEILEGGNLEYEITVSGKDELAALARSLDDMRKSFKENMDNETKMQEANQKMITEMSHDLRTPLTSLLLYTGFLSQHKYKDEQQMQEYAQLIDRKAQQMKQLSDNIFEYSLISGRKEAELEPPELFESVFYDHLSELAGYLEENGYQVETDISWEECKVSINTGYLMRILDNVISNIQKYADHEYPVKIGTVYQAGTCGFYVENSVSGVRQKAESTHIGVENMKGMMGQMNGFCQVTQEEKNFRITFYFGCV